MNATTYERAAENAERHLRSAYRYAKRRAQDKSVDVRRVIREAISEQEQDNDVRHGARFAPQQ